MSPPKNIVINFECPDKPGIVSSVTSLFADMNFTIVESSQHQDPHSERFFMRTEYRSLNGSELTLNEIRARFSEIADSYAMHWDIFDSELRPKVLIAVSKWGHCLNNLLNSWKQGTLPIDIVGVVSNHDDMRSLTEWYGLEYHHLPMVKGEKEQQETKILELFEEGGADLLVLARYMQILSNNMCQKLEGKAINIHHSFLPGFKGAKPYHQAYDRGVKLIGATAHFVTSDLDEGPIIEQSVVRVSHANKPEELVEIGRDVESAVLSRAVKWYAEHRIIRNENKTVVFTR